jgi:hypothetical protein
MSLDDRYGPRLDDEEVGALVAFGKEDITVRHRPAPAEPPESRHLLLVEARGGTADVGGLGEPCGDWRVISIHCFAERPERTMRQDSHPVAGVAVFR